ncbi:MAG: DUF3500 domain-containing protein [Chloroflexi bacterium]|nr:DUF3500 domain-containing protein [Chloroflexota bacterium]
MTTASEHQHSHAPAAATRMSAAAQKFLEALSSGQREMATFDFSGDERYVWNYTPVDRNGLMIMDMDDAQRQIAFDLMATGLSKSGNDTAHQIITIEKELGESEAAENSDSPWTRSPERYWFSVFGEPGGDAPWGWRVGGHHVCLHYTIVDGRLVTPNPLFFGANPAQIRHGEREGLRTLPAEEDIARSIVTGFNADHRSIAIVDGDTPQDILTKSYRTADPAATPAGLAYSQMDADSREQLVKLMRHYVNRASDDLAANSWGKIESAGFDDVTFAWAGPDTPGQGHYYAIKGKAFLIEYDNTQNGANHIHSVFRDYENDWGEDVLAAHYGGTSHH